MKKLSSSQESRFFMVMNYNYSLKTNRTKVTSEYTRIFDQNIRSIRNKTHELISYLHPDLPHIICLTEHHLTAQEVHNVANENYTVGANYCRTLYQRGGSIIYIHNSLKCVNIVNIDLSDYCEEKDLEICAIKINTKTLTMCIIVAYRAPSGNFTLFLQRLDNVLKLLNTHSTSLIICGDLNIKYLVDNDQKRQLDNLLLIYNLKGIVDFPTRTTRSTASAIDNFIINTAQITDFSATPSINGLSDHKALILSLNIPIHTETDRVTYTRIIDKYTIPDFIYKISSESWDEVFNSRDIDFMFNSFHNTYLIIYYSSFPLSRTKRRNFKHNWPTLGIKTSYKCKRALFLMQRNNSDPVPKQYSFLIYFTFH